MKPLKNRLKSLSGRSPLGIGLLFALFPGHIREVSMLIDMLARDFPLSTARSRLRTVMVRSGGVPVALSVWTRHPEASTVLFYPGTMASPLMYTILLEELWNQGLNVVGLHPLSHGASPRVKKVFTFEDMLDNGLDAARWAREHFSGPLVVSGHSQGGILALAHATRDAESKACLPLCTLLPQLPGAASLTIFHRLESHKDKLLAVMRFLAALLPRLPLPLTAYLDLGKAMAGHRQVLAPRRHLRWTYPLAYISSLFNCDLSAATREGVITCPVVLFTARDDALFTLPFMRETLHHIAAPHKKLQVIEGGGHMFAVSRVYAPQVAARMAEQCAAFGLPLRSELADAKGEA